MADNKPVNEPCVC